MLKAFNAVCSRRRLQHWKQRARDRLYRRNRQDRPQSDNLHYTDVSAKEYSRHSCRFRRYKRSRARLLQCCNRGLEQTRLKCFQHLPLRTRFGEHRGIGNAEWNLKNLGQCAGKIGFTRPRFPDHNDVRLLDGNIIVGFFCIRRL